MKEILEFLIRAKKNTYANGNAAKVNSSILESKDYQYDLSIENINIHLNNLKQWKTLQD